MFNLVKVVTLDGDKFLVLNETTSAAELAEALGVTPAEAVSMLRIGEVKVSGEVQTDPNNILAAAHNWVNRYIQGETITAGIINRLFGTPKAEAEFNDDDKLAIAADSTFVPRHDGIISSTLKVFVSGTSAWVAAHLGSTEEEVAGMYQGDYQKAVGMAEQSILSYTESQAAPATSVDPKAIETALLENQQPVAEGVPAEQVEEVTDEPVDTTEPVTDEPADEAAALVTDEPDAPAETGLTIPNAETGIAPQSDRKILVASLAMNNRLLTNVMEMLATIQEYQTMLQGALEVEDDVKA